MTQHLKEEKKIHIPTYKIYQYFIDGNSELIHSPKKTPYTIVPDKEDIELIFILERNIHEQKSQLLSPKPPTPEQKSHFSSLRDSKHVKQFYSDTAHLNQIDQIDAYKKNPSKIIIKYSYQLENMPSNLKLHRYAPLPGTQAFQAGLQKYSKYQFESAIVDLEKIAEYYPTAYLLLGMSYTFLNKRQEANLAFRGAVEHKEWIFNRLNVDDGLSWFFAGFYLDKIDYDPRAAIFYNKAIKLNCAHAQAVVGMIYLKERRHNKALTLLQQSAKQADPHGQIYLATFYTNLQLCERKVYWLKKSAKQGSALAQTKLALHYLQQKSPDLEAAIHLLKKAIVHKCPEALYLFGMMNIDAMGLDRDIALGIDYLKQSADFNFTKANYMLGKFYYDGIELAHDANLARKYWEKAAADGFELAIKNLADFFPDTEASTTLNCSK
jgi:TPR repeat protein